MFYFLIPLVCAAMSFLTAMAIQSIEFALLGIVFGVISALFIVLAELESRADQLRWHALKQEARRHG